jgi:hypothetical protein
LEITVTPVSIVDNATAIIKAANRPCFDALEMCMISPGEWRVQPNGGHRITTAV